MAEGGELLLTDPYVETLHTDRELAHFRLSMPPLGFLRGQSVHEKWGRLGETGVRVAERQRDMRGIWLRGKYALLFFFVFWCFAE